MARIYFTQVILYHIISVLSIFSFNFIRIFVSVLFKKYIKALLFTTNLLKFLHIRGTMYMIVLFLLIILISYWVIPFSLGINSWFTSEAGKQKIKKKYWIKCDLGVSKECEPSANILHTTTTGTFYQYFFFIFRPSTP